MAMRKEFRPFNAEQAKAGAPYDCLDDNYKAKILHWEKYAVIGMESLSDFHSAGHWHCIEWTPEGIASTMKTVTVCDLVMLPLFHLQSKPVYMGDKLYDANGSLFEVDLEHTQSMIDGCTWEVPRAKVESKLSAKELSDLYSNTAGSTVYCLNVIANAAIARAIEDGDVVTKDKVKDIVEFVYRLDVTNSDSAWIHVEAGFF